MDFNIAYMLGIICFIATLCFILAYHFSYKFNLILDKHEQVKRIAQKRIQRIKNTIPQHLYERSPDDKRWYEESTNSIEKLSNIFSNYNSLKEKLKEKQKDLKKKKKTLKEIYKTPTSSLESRFKTEKEIKDLKKSIQKIHIGIKSDKIGIHNIFDEFDKIETWIND